MKRFLKNRRPARLQEQENISALRILRELQSVRSRIEILDSVAPSRIRIFRNTSTWLFSMPDHLVDTYMAVLSEGKSDATSASAVTGRARSTECDHLNQLFREGWLYKFRNSRTMVFQPAAQGFNITRKPRASRF